MRESGTTSVAGENEYSFKHILIRDVAYGQLPKKLRAVLHRRFAGWVNGLPGGRDEFAEFVPSSSILKIWPVTLCTSVSWLSGLELEA